MVSPSNIIRVPDPEAGSYDHNRLAGKLLQSQTLHLREALLQHLKELAAVLAVDPKTLKTEGEVSSYIHKATALLHTHAAKPAEEVR
jgi:hypothetical protein